MLYLTLFAAVALLIVLVWRSWLTCVWLSFGVGVYPGWGVLMIHLGWLWVCLGSPRARRRALARRDPQLGRAYADAYRQRYGGR